MKTDTAADPIAFSVRVKPVTWGDNATFYQYRIVMRLSGRVVGFEEGPGRTCATHEDARRAGWARVRQLGACRLYAIDVTRKDISRGEAHSCEACAIAQALYRNQERMGFERREYDFRVAPYGGIGTEGYGIALCRNGAEDLLTGMDKMPDLVFPSKRTGFATECMMEWAMLWDEWAARQTMSISDWRETYDRGEDETPCRPWPVSFVLNLTEMKPGEAN